MCRPTISLGFHNVFIHLCPLSCIYVHGKVTYISGIFTKHIIFKKRNFVCVCVCAAYVTDWKKQVNLTSYHARQYVPPLSSQSLSSWLSVCAPELQCDSPEIENTHIIRCIHKCLISGERWGINTIVGNTIEIYIWSNNSGMVVPFSTTIVKILRRHVRGTVCVPHSSYWRISEIQYYRASFCTEIR
jgi:hypothetical protein